MWTDALAQTSDLVTIGNVRANFNLKVLSIVQLALPKYLKVNNGRKEGRSPSFLFLPLPLREGEGGHRGIGLLRLANFKG